MVNLPDFIQIFGTSLFSSQAHVIKMNAVIDIAAIVAGIVEKARRQEQWMTRLQNLKTCGDQVQAEFDKLTFYSVAQKILTTLDDDLVVLEKEIADLTLLHRRTGQKIVKEVLKKAHNIRYECLRLCEALGRFQHNCRFDMFYAIMVKELKYNVGCLQYAVGQVPDYEKIRREIRDHTGVLRLEASAAEESTSQWAVFFVSG
ncbi:unnamed protein product [Caenorhabditis auriculariae]|uniref:Uncharacterized protein n=1 Tax=Caenorhabditis auriculariae TaxID=2777116 RepID=A0A8S1HT50_9PELO|nr:unnamed protein product [Caenorhabditis auriculariae]